jgi:hypothetical protein
MLPSVIGSIGSLKRFVVILRGRAELSDFRGGYSGSKLQKTTVVTLPDGFTVMPWASRVGSVDLLCVACNVSAVPLRNRRPDDKGVLL